MSSRDGDWRKLKKKKRIILSELVLEKMEPVKRDIRTWKGYVKRSILLIMSVIMIPIMMTVLLSAFEDRTNDWVLELLGLKTYQTKTLETLKEQVAIGKLTEDLCTHLGARTLGVTKMCGKAVKRNTIFTTDSGQFEQRWHRQNKRELFFEFHNDVLQSIVLLDPKYQTIKEKEVTEIWGPPDQMNDYQSLKEKKLIFYEAEFELAFIIDLTSSQLKRIQMSYKGGSEPKKAIALQNQSDPNRKRIHRGDPKLQLTGNGVKAVQQVKQYIDQGKLPYYDCDLLGSTFNPSKLCKPNPSISGYDQDEQTKWLSYQFQNRFLFLQYYQDSLALITVDGMGKLPFTREDVKKVFGKPKFEQKKYGAWSSGALVYEIGDRELVFNFTEKDQGSYIQFRLADVFEDDQSVMQVKRVKKEKNQKKN